MKSEGFFAAAVLFASPAWAQTNGTFLLTSSNTVSPSSATTTIGVWASWDNSAWGVFTFALGDYDLAASDGRFSNPVNVLNGPGSSTGAIAGNVISGAINGQVIIPAVPPISPRNPILLATYDWATTDFTPRTVDLRTSNTSTFVVYHPLPLTIVELYPREFTPGSGVVDVVSCYADCDLSGVLDIFDFLCFQNSFVNAEPYACECDPDPACNIFDFLCFQSAFVAGCP